MIDCAGLSDRMVAVAHGVSVWEPGEQAHLHACRDCADEWRLVQAGGGLAHDTVIDTERILVRLHERLRTPVPQLRPASRPLRQVAMVAMAASIALLFLVPTVRRATNVAVVVPAVVVLPELERLNEHQLEAVLTELDGGNDVLSPMRLPRMGDLTVQQLELVLHELGG
ncbi:MAG: hypothetical protein ABJC19_00465 [Gemmatimonadota bacterium]